MQIGSKIAAARQGSKLRQIDLAARIGVGVRSIRNYEANNGKISVDILEKIADACGVHITYFFPINVYNFAHVEMQDTSHFPKNRDDDIIVNIPLYSENDQMSSTTILTLSKKELDMHFGIKEIGSICALRAAGNSMEPTIQEGSFVLIQEDENEVIDGYMYAVKHKNTVFIKRLQTMPKIKLFADNDKYEPIIVEDEKQLKVIGRVLGSIFIKKY